MARRKQGAPALVTRAATLRAREWNRLPAPGPPSETVYTLRKV